MLRSLTTHRRKTPLSSNVGTIVPLLFLFLMVLSVLSSTTAQLPSIAPTAAPTAAPNWFSNSCVKFLPNTGSNSCPECSNSRPHCCAHSSAIDLVQTHRPTISLIESNLHGDYKTISYAFNQAIACSKQHSDTNQHCSTNCLSIRTMAEVTFPNNLPLHRYGSQCEWFFHYSSHKLQTMVQWFKWSLQWCKQVQALKQLDKIWVDYASCGHVQQ